MLSGDAASPGKMLSTLKTGYFPEKVIFADQRNYQGIFRCQPKNSEAMAPSSGAHEGLMCPLEKGVGGFKTLRTESQ